jgi:drug/metabolite transporter (DMT)-like permease
MIYYYVLIFLVIVFTSIAHLCLKKGSVNLPGSKTSMYTNPYSLAAYAIFAFVAFLSIYAQKGFDLKVFFALNSLTYICIPLLSFIVLREACTRNKLIGIVIIALGVIIFNF